MKNKTNDLNSKTRNLTTFTSPLATKKIVPSEEGVLSGEATRGAKAGKKSIEIIELATKHQVTGKQTDLETKIKAGKFAIVSGKEKIELEFTGGSLNDLTNLIKNSAASIANTHLIRVNPEEGILSLTATKSGIKSKLKFMDPDGILFQGGLVGEYTPPPEAKTLAVNLDITKTDAFQSEKFENNIQPAYNPIQSETGIELKTLTAYSFLITETKPQEDDYLRFQLNGESKPPRLDVGIYYKVGEEERYKNASIFPTDEGYVWKLDDSLKGKAIQKVVITNSGEESIFISKLELVSQPEWKGAEPIQNIAEAKDAKFKIDGVEISRDKNEGLNDVLESVSLNLLKVTEKPITFDIEPETDKGKELIKSFVKSYNELILFSKEITAVDRDGKISDKDFAADNDRKADIGKDFWKNKEKTGLLAGDNAVLRLTSGLKTIISGAYPNKQEKGFRTLAEIGISTGQIGTSWEKMQDGLLQIDEDLLNRALNENPEAVKELFASDLNSDAVSDEGVGYRIVEHLKPYNQFTGGIVNSKIQLLEDNISDNKKKIKNQEAHILAYEGKLKQRFLYMEQGVGRNKSIGNYLNNNLRGAQ
nr:flagellar hook-associated protein FliD [Leptospira sp. GIMC2001]